MQHPSGSSWLDSLGGWWSGLSNTQKAYTVVAAAVAVLVASRVAMFSILAAERVVVASLLVLEEAIAAAILSSAALVSGWWAVRGLCQHTTRYVMHTL